VSREEQRVVGLIASAVGRARRLLVAEAIGWMAAASALAFELTGSTRWTLGARAIAVGAAAAVTGFVVGLWRRPAVARASILRRVEREDPLQRNLIVTADELARGALHASPPTRARVFADAAAASARVDVRRVAPMRPVVAAALAAVGAMTFAATEPLWRVRVAPAVRELIRDVRGTSASVSALHVAIAIQPPAYTLRPPTSIRDPAQIEAIEGSELLITATSGASRVVLEHDGASRALARGRDGTFTDRVRVTKTGYLIVGDGRAQQTIPIVVVPDALPSVRMVAPGRDLVYARGDARIAFDARATDDFGLRSLVLRYTKVSGSGENFEFHDDEIPLEVTRATARDWSGRATRSVSDLGLREGDMLVYRAVAADARPGDATGSSDAFFIEISRLGAAAGDAFTLPQEETRYALSQQMLIIKTERLQQRRATASPDAFKEDALNLAVEQRMIRAEFVFMLGGEVQDEEAEAEQSSELQEGRLQNRGQRDVRAATVAMSQAEKALSGADTVEALAAERSAVAALQRAFARDRYILRALGSRSQLDLSRRLTGSTAGAHDWRRPIAPAPENRRAALLEDLLRGLAELARTAPSASAHAAVLAAEAIRIDPASPAMRDVAAAMQRLGRSSGDRVSTAQALSAATRAAIAESRRAHADPAVGADRPARPLAAAFEAALRDRR